VRAAGWTQKAGFTGIQDTLNTAGLEGWELVDIEPLPTVDVAAPDEHLGWILFFKRLHEGPISAE